MKRIIAWLSIMGLAAWTALAAPAAEKAGLGGPARGTAPAPADVKMRIFEGLREAGGGSAEAVTSSFLKYVLSASFESEADLSAEQLQIRRVFKLDEVRLLTESDYKWTGGNTDRISHVFRLGTREYQVYLTPRGPAGEQRFRVEVLEPRDGGAGGAGAGDPASLLDTEFSAPKAGAAVFGFEDTRGKPYFISLRAVRSAADVGGVKLLKKAEPVYPEAAKKAGVEGTVILEGNADVQGRVVSVKVLKSVPLLDQAAVDALKQWVYEPFRINGKPWPFVFTVTMRFRLEAGKADVSSRQGVEGGVVGGVQGGVQGALPAGALMPKVIKTVDPVYPEIAIESKVGGTVVLEGTADVYGRVAVVKVLRSVPLLDQAAIDALRQWVYEPMILDGKPRPFVFTVTMTFRVEDGKGRVESKQRGVVGSPEGEAGREKTEEGVVRAVGEVKPPRLVKSVDPVYPEAARKAHVEGVVILEATTDKEGHVVNVKVLRSIPVLDQAAVDAVKQWKYEPLVINGKPQGVVFTVTVRFQLKTGQKEKDLEKFAVGAVMVQGDIAPPKLLTYVTPSYPEEARQAGVQGVVILAVKTDAAGQVVDVMVLRSVPMLNQAAIDAVRQWRYAPLVVNGVATPVVFTATVNFTLK